MDVKGQMNGFAALDIHPHRRYVVDIGGRRSSRCRLHINFALFLHSLDFTQNLGVTLLLDGRLELTNNLAERTVKPFVMARRNFLFCDTAKGADASALCFSVIETAKRNGLDPFGYLMFLLQELPKLGPDPAEEQLLPLLPWSPDLPGYCKIKQ